MESAMLMNSLSHHSKAITVIFGASLLAACSCKSTVITMTGTTVGLEASPGDTTNGEPPSVLFGYKRAEVAIIPVPRETPGASTVTADHSKPPDDATTSNSAEPRTNETSAKQSNSSPAKTDAFSVLASFNLALNWFGPAKIEQFIATGHAARNIQGSILRSMSGATDNLASKFKSLQTNNADSGCWKAIQAWKATHLHDVKEKDFVEDQRQEDNRAASLNDTTVKNACQGQPELR